MYTGLITTLYTLNFIKLYVNYSPIRASLVSQTVKNLPAVWETWIEFLGREDPLEENMATHFSILAWRIPWTEYPGRLHPNKAEKKKTWAVHLYSHCQITLGAMG